MDDTMRMTLKELWTLLKETAVEWIDDDAPRLGAALAYYTVFSLAPLLIIVLFVIGIVWGNQVAEARAEILAQVERLTGAQGARIISDMLANAERPGSGGVLATVLGVGALLFGATGVFAQLQGALNKIWEVAAKPGRGLKGFVSTRLLSFALVLLIGFLLLLLLIAGTLIAALKAWLGGVTAAPPVLFQALDVAVSFGLITLLFAVIYRYLPDVEIAWSDVWTGAAITALLFALGKFGISLYLGQSSTASIYGPASSLAVLLLWVYYSALILFFGAEFTQVYARQYGERIRPSEHAVSLRDEPLSSVAAPSTSKAVPPPTLQAPQKPSALKRLAVIVLAFLLGRFLGRRR